MKVAPAFVGRAVELDRLRAAVDPRGRANARLIVVTGPAGVGKTRLVEEAVTPFESTAAVVWTRAQHVDRDQPFGSVDDLIRVLKRDSVNWPSEVGGPQLVGTIEAAIERFVSSQPLIVVAEDFHWADPASWRTLRSLAARVRDIPLSLIITIRTPFAGDGVTVLDRMRAYGADTVEVADLSADDIRELATITLGETPDEAADSLLGRAGGNALFATEIIRSLRDANTTSIPPQKRSKGLPSTLRSAVLSRLIGLGPRERQLLSLASLLGTSFAVSELAEIADRSVVEVVAELDVALRAGVVKADRHALRFSHALVADCIREDQPRQSGLRCTDTLHRSSLLGRRARSGSPSTTCWPPNWPIPTTPRAATPKRRCGSSERRKRPSSPRSRPRCRCSNDRCAYQFPGRRQRLDASIWPPCSCSPVVSPKPKRPVAASLKAVSTPSLRPTKCRLGASSPPSYRFAGRSMQDQRSKSSIGLLRSPVRRPRRS